MDALLRQAAAAIKNADALLITAGAGMGVDSGLPDFRGDNGFWQAYPVAAVKGYTFADLANPAWFKRDPHLAWAFYGHRLNLYRQTVPHAGFTQLLHLARTKPHGFFVFTSNVDGQFQKAGYPENSILECHGSIHHFQCTTPCNTRIWSAPPQNIDIDDVQFLAADPLPRCPHCSALARPNILMFGDFDWLPARSSEQEKRFNAWLTRLDQIGSKLTVIELGAGTALPTVRCRSENAAFRPGATFIRINPREAQVPKGEIGLPLGAAAAIDKLYRLVSSL